MKKILSIILLFVLLFNWVGYRLFTAYLETKSFQNIVAAFDKNEIGNTELISVKIPSALPYYTGTGEFERITGEIEIGQVHYSYVQRKVTHDTIEYLCIVNREKSAVKKAAREYYTLINDVGQKSPSKKDHSSLTKFLQVDVVLDEQSARPGFQQKPSVLQSDYRNNFYKSLALSPPDLPPNSRA